MRKTRDFKVNEQHMRYMEKIKDELMQAQDTVNRIKGSKDYKNAQHYFTLLKHRGIIEECPSYKNGYKVELLESVPLDELRNILTESQYQKVKEALEQKKKEENAQ